MTRALTRVALLGLAMFLGCTSHEERGDEAALRGDWDGALAHYERALARDPADAAITRKRSTALERARAAHLAAARTLRADHQLDEAIAEQRRAIELADPADHPALNAELDEMLGARSRRDAQALADRASAQFAAARLSAAERLARHALERDEHNAAARELLPRILDAQRAAQPSIEQAVELERAGQLPTALEAYEQARTRWLDSERIRDGLARCHARLDHDRLLAEGEQLASTGRFIEAQQAFEAACAAFDSPSARAALDRVRPRAESQELVQAARGALDSGAITRAIQAAQRARELDPDHPAAQQLLEEALGRRGAAIERFDAAERLERAGHWEQAAALYGEAHTLWRERDDAHQARERCLSRIEHAACLQRAHAHMAARAWDPALAELDAAARIADDPELTRLRERCERGKLADELAGRAELHRAARQLSSALAALDALRQADPDHPALGPLGSHIALDLAPAERALSAALAAHANGRYPAAVALYEQALATWVDCPRAQVGLERARRGEQP